MKASTRTVSICLALLVAVVLPSCNSSGGSSLSGQGQLDVYLTDAPACLPDVQSVVVTITGVSVIPDDMDQETQEGTEAPPIPILNFPATLDLLQLTDGVTTLLASATLPAGVYSKIRLEISDAVMTFTDGTSVDLKIDSHKVDVLLHIQVAEGGTTTVTLDFSACDSIHVTTTGSSTYILRPVVNALMH